MARPFGSLVVLTPEVRRQLQAIVRAGSSPQSLAFRCRIILRAAGPDDPSNLRIANELDCDRQTVGQWRERFVKHGLVGLQDLPRSGRPRSFSPAQRVDIFSIATSKTEAHDQPASRWTLDDIAAAIVNEACAETINRSTVWRALHDADLKPHRSVYWLNSHDPDFDAKARSICQLYIQAPHWYQQGRLLVCSDEKTGMQILQRNAPTQLVQPGKPEKQEFEYTRLGTRALIASFAVPSGEVVWDLGPTRTNLDFRAHIWRVARHFSNFQRIDWIVDNLNTHCSLELCELLAYLNGVPFTPKQLQNQKQRRLFLSNPEHSYKFHYVPLHGSWLNQVELWFSVLSRQFLRRGNFASAKEFEERLRQWLDRYNQEQAHPYQWTYTGQPLVRATPFSKTRRQQRQGRAWFGSRRQRFDRVLYPPRPYRRQDKQVRANL